MHHDASVELEGYLAYPAAPSKAPLPVVLVAHAWGGHDEFVRSKAHMLADLGYIVYAPQNPYIGQDRFRVLQRKANPLGQSLFSVIIAQRLREIEAPRGGERAAERVLRRPPRVLAQAGRAHHAAVEEDHRGQGGLRDLGPGFDRFEQAQDLAMLGHGRIPALQCNP